MILSADVEIPFPRDRVFAAYRDELPDVARFLPHIESVIVESRVDEGPVTRLTNLWRATGRIPEAAQRVISPEALGFRDYAVWDARTWNCTWRMEPLVLVRHVRCEGENVYREVQGHTVLSIRGSLDLDLRGVPGVPRMVADSAARLAERFLAGRLQTSLGAVAAALTRHLEGKNAS